MITQEALQAVTFEVMTYRMSAFTPINMQQPLNNYLNLEQYCDLVIHPNTGETITNYSKLANYPLEEERCGRQRLVKNLEASPKAAIEQGENI